MYMIANNPLRYSLLPTSALLCIRQINNPAVIVTIINIGSIGQELRILMFPPLVSSMTLGKVV
jgi:hypothetical protein